jgi:hypothetical protein
LLHLISKKQKFAVKVLLDKIDDRGSELTWNSSGTIYIDKTSIPNSNVFTVYPYLFQKTWPKRDVPGLKEVVAKLEQIGLNNLIVLNQKQIIADSNSTASLDPKGGHSSLEATGTHSFHSNDDVPKSEADLSFSSWPWWFID